jgi:hypothetical protein
LFYSLAFNSSSVVFKATVNKKLNKKKKKKTDTELALKTTEEELKAKE